MLPSSSQQYKFYGQLSKPSRDFHQVFQKTSSSTPIEIQIKLAHQKKTYLPQSQIRSFLAESQKQLLVLNNHLSSKKFYKHKVYAGFFSASRYQNMHKILDKLWSQTGKTMVNVNKWVLKKNHDYVFQYNANQKEFLNYLKEPKIKEQLNMVSRKRYYRMTMGSKTLQKGDPFEQTLKALDPQLKQIRFYRLFDSTQYFISPGQYITINQVFEFQHEQYPKLSAQFKTLLEKKMMQEFEAFIKTVISTNQCKYEVEYKLQEKSKAEKFDEQELFVFLSSRMDLLNQIDCHRQTSISNFQFEKLIKLLQNISKDELSNAKQVVSIKNLKETNPTEVQTKNELNTQVATKAESKDQPGQKIKINKTTDDKNNQNLKVNSLTQSIDEQQNAKEASSSQNQED